MPKQKWEDVKEKVLSKVKDPKSVSKERRKADVRKRDSGEEGSASEEGREEKRQKGRRKEKGRVLAPPSGKGPREKGPLARQGRGLLYTYED